MALSKYQASVALKLFSRNYIFSTNRQDKEELCRDFIDTFKLDIKDIKDQMKHSLLESSASEELQEELNSIINNTNKTSNIGECVIADLSMEDEEQIVRLISKEIDVMPHFSAYDDGSIKDFMNTGYSFVVKKNDEVVGVVLAHKHMEYGSFSIYLNIFAVNEAAQGQGIGKMMMTHLKRLAKADGITSIKLYTKKYLKAYNIYRHLGFFDDDEKEGVHMSGYVF